MLAGSFRFVTGTSPKSDYLINTPSGTIGVRGTGFDVYVDDKGVTHIMMYDGETQLCDKHTKACKLLTNLCQVGQMDSSGVSDVGNLNNITGAERGALKLLFKYSMNQSPLDGNFHLDGAFECTHKPAPVSPPTSGGSASEGITD